MLNNTFYYDQHSTRLQIDGLPDYSKGQDKDSIGIITAWKLQITGYPELEGQKQHLNSLLNVIFPYVRVYLTGNKKSFGDLSSSVSIIPISNGHKLVLRSSKQEVKDLEIILDDAELIDLVTCLDKFKTDKRVNISWDLHSDIIASNKFNYKNFIHIKSIIPLLIGLSSIIFTSIIFIILPNNVRFIEIENQNLNKEFKTEDLEK